MKYWFLTLFTALLLATPSLSAQTFSRPSIEAALDDELYPLAEEQAWASLSVRQTSEEVADLTILLVRSLIGQERFDDAVILADESSHLLQQDAFAYWKARALFEADDFRAVFPPLETLSEKSTYAPAGLRLTGRAASASEDLKLAEKAFELFEKKFPTHENAAQNLFDLAHVQLNRERERAAAKTMHKLLQRFPNTVLADSVRLLLARELLSNDGKKERREAAELLIQLGENETAHPRLRIAAWVELATLEQRAGHSTVAADALRSAELLTDKASLRARQKTARANLLVDEEKTTEALLLFEEAMKEAPDEYLAAEILLQKAEALLKVQQFAEAEKAFQAYLNVTTDPNTEARALFGKGWSLWEQLRYEEAASTFEQAAAKCTDVDRCATAWVKAGDARLAAGQAGMASENYNRLLTDHPTHPLNAYAMYQYGISLRTAGETEGAHLTFKKTEADFPKSDFAPRAALKQAEKFKADQLWERALQEYQRVANQYPDETTQATALHQQGLILFGFDRFDGALEKFQTVRETYPESPEAPQATYMQGFCRYLQGDIEAALEICRSFVSTYPNSLWTSEVLFWLGEHSYNRGNYPEAQSTFLDIVARFPLDELADEALFWAGNALLQQDSFLEAFTLYSRLAKEYPQSALLLKTRFAQGEALTELGEFPRAVLAYQEVIQSAPDDPLADRARGRLGDCFFTLGATEPDRYQEAIEAYQALYKRPSVPFALKLQALYKVARCEDKAGLTDKSFAHYMETVYEAGRHTEALSPEAVLWFTRAALEAAAQQEQQTLWKEAIHIYERIIQAGVPARDEAAKRIEKIRKEALDFRP